MSKRPIIGPGTGSAEKLAQPWSSQTRSSCSVAAKARAFDQRLGLSLQLRRDASAAQRTAAADGAAEEIDPPNLVEALSYPAPNRICSSRGSQLRDGALDATCEQRHIWAGIFPWHSRYATICII